MTPAEPVAAVPTDAALIAAWHGGDEPAAAELVRRHARALARFLAGAGALAADVDDLVQETFIRAFRALARFRGQCQFRTWLMTIGGNVLKDAHRRARRAAWCRWATICGTRRATRMSGRWPGRRSSGWPPGSSA